jgi:hypothetical protein
MKVRRIRFRTWVVGGLALGALGFPVAAQARYDVEVQGKPVASPQQYLTWQKTYFQQSPAVSSIVVDGRSPDTKDFAQQAQLMGGGALDLRSPDTRDAAVLAHESGTTLARSGGFDWRDAGIGLLAGGALVLLVAIALLQRRRPKPGRAAIA